MNRVVAVVMGHVLLAPALSAHEGHGSVEGTDPLHLLEPAHLVPLIAAAALVALGNRLRRRGARGSVR